MTIARSPEASGPPAGAGHAATARRDVDSSQTLPAVPCSPEAVIQTFAGLIDAAMVDTSDVLLWDDDDTIIACRATLALAAA